MAHGTKLDRKVLRKLRGKRQKTGVAQGFHVSKSGAVVKNQGGVVKRRIAANIGVLEGRVNSFLPAGASVGPKPRNKRYRINQG